MNESLILTQLTSSAIVVYLLNVLKNSKWFTLLTNETKTLNRVAAIVISFLVGLGIHFQFDKTSGTLIITGLTTIGILHGLWHFINSFATQELIYQTTKAKSAVIVQPLQAQTQAAGK